MSKKQPEKINVTVIKSTSVAGEPLEVGKSATLKAEDAKALIAAGKAKETEFLTRSDKEQIAAEERRLKTKADMKSGKTVDAATEKKLKAGSGDDGSGSGDGNEEKTIDDLTIPELKAELNELGVEYGAKDKREVLVELLQKAIDEAGE